MTLLYCQDNSARALAGFDKHVGLGTVGKIERAVDPDAERAAATRFIACMLFISLLYRC